ncbi:hypothetical protein [Pseudomonas sp. Pseu.R1]|uniref:hypothetical protein n=1 Tax=Pseudomonas sp. Pseu.R1 TaxID=3379818 RepID=UPI003B92BC47
MNAMSARKKPQELTQNHKIAAFVVIQSTKGIIIRSNPAFDRLLECHVTHALFACDATKG